MASEEPMRSLLAAFSDPEAARRYSEGPQRFVPGLADLYRMTAVLLAERAHQDAKVLVLGAGGGLELRALSNAQPTWRFAGIDPAAPMLDEAKRLLGSEAARVDFHEGYIDDAPEGPFDAATCFLTLHFLGVAERKRTVRELHRRLKPGAPFVVAHSSFPQEDGTRGLWLSRYAAFALASGADPEQVEKMRAAVDAHLPVLSPQEDEAVLHQAGFSKVSLFYAALTWRGWIAYA